MAAAAASERGGDEATLAFTRSEPFDRDGQPDKALQKISSHHFFFCLEMVLDAPLLFIFSF